MAVEGVDRSVGTPGQPASTPVKGGNAPPTPLPGRSSGKAVPAKPSKPDIDVEVEVQNARPAKPALVNASASFALDESSGLITIQIVNSSTGELIREIPARDYVRMVQASDNVIGTLFEAQS
jgi:hypothetical protein